MQRRRRHRADRRLRPFREFGLNNSGLEPRNMASSAIIGLFHPLAGTILDALEALMQTSSAAQPGLAGRVLAAPLGTQAGPSSSRAGLMASVGVGPRVFSQTAPFGVSLGASVADIPGYVITFEPGIYSESVTAGTGLLAADASNGKEQPVANFAVPVRLPSGVTGAVAATANNQNLLDTVATPDAGPNIDVSFGMELQIAETQLVRPMPVPLSLTGIDGSGLAPGGAPPAITWTFVDTSKPGFPAWGSVQGNPPLLISGSFTVHFGGFIGTGGWNPPSTPPDQHGGALNGTGIFFVSTATGVSVVGPVTDPATGNPSARAVYFPRFKWARRLPPRYTVL